MDANRRESAENLGLQSVFDRFIRVYWRSFAVDLNSYKFLFAAFAISVD